MSSNDAAIGPDVRLRDVRKRFGGFEAVKGISFEVGKAEFVTLLGPSGCGKTTTLRMIGGFEEADAGEVDVLGRPVSVTPPGERHTRMVFQNYALFPHMTAFQNVAFGLRTRKVNRSDIERRVGEILEKVGLGDKAKRYPRELSGGQQQRVALARALVTRPSVLLLDEPLGALDLKMRKQMQVELKQLQRDVAITFIYVTHDQEEALALSDRIVVMDHGTIAQQGLAEEIYKKPISRYVADFIGESNFLPGTLLARSDNRVEVDVGGCRLTAGTAVGAITKAGSGVLMAVRPEQIAVSRNGVDKENTLEGVVQQRLFLGPITRLSVSLSAGPMLTVDAKESSEIHEGDVVYVGWNSGNAIVLQS